MPNSRRAATAFPLIYVTSLALIGCRSNQAPPPQAMPAIPVTVATALQKNVPIQVRAIGNVEPYSSITIKAQVAGELVRVLFKEGDDVKTGDLLFEIDRRSYEQALHQAEANLGRDKAQEKLAEANLARDLAQAENARSQASRYGALAKEGIVSREQNDQMRTAARSADESAVADRAAIDSARAAVTADEAAVEKAKLDLEYCSIRSPLNGRTGSLQVKQGTLVKSNADTSLVTINQVYPIYVTFSVPEDKLAAIRRAMSKAALTVTATVSGDSGPPSHGQLTFIDNSVDSTTGAIKLKATFSNQERKLWPGQFVNVVMTLGQEQNVTVVPSEAVQTGAQGQYVFVVKQDHTVENRVVTLDRTVDRETIIRTGVAPGETVVTDGQLRLIPGFKVQIVSGNPGASGGKAGGAS